MSSDECPGSRRPFRPGTLSRDREVAECPDCGGNFYVTDSNALEPHEPFEPPKMYQFALTDIGGNQYGYDATDMRMALTLHAQLYGTEPIRLELVGESS